MVKIVSVELNPVTNCLEVVKRKCSNAVYLSNQPVPDTITKEIWGVGNNELQLIKIIQGVHEPSYVVEERIIFE